MSIYLDPKTESELSQIPEIKQALDLAEESAYTPAELVAYDKYWDAISVEKTLTHSARAEGKAEGRAEGIEEGIEMGISQGEMEAKRAIARKLLIKGVSIEEIVVN